MYSAWSKINPVLMILIFLLSFYGYCKYSTFNKISREVCKVEGFQYSNTVTGTVKNYIVSCSGVTKRAGSYLNGITAGRLVEVEVKYGYLGDDVTIVAIVN
ncbi:hypothetical protein [Vibrio sp. B1FLJ16]|uniref:hypothetical protein n=1 Tax=Vibrio sp. B1FLJ16 TaxID=2751178 RepID=UPI001AFBD787|nr:hypothetical protein [Vibrio sp. B1FLJ16]CAD7816932.1 hypothetical protein ACOMICROBIO_EPCKBFOG_03081 [Vibrio sp. B1FLJ16]CAE6929655.1 hypothetical protein ACOMICROBIO_EPCKBFOG_03081 [Vibrio sp. B1FLJ16]